MDGHTVISVLGWEDSAESDLIAVIFAGADGGTLAVPLTREALRQLSLLFPSEDPRSGPGEQYRGT
ncbi:hypothetical protein [Cellulomonas hominis]